MKQLVREPDSWELSPTAGVSIFRLLLLYELILIEVVHPTRNLTLVDFVCNIQITCTSAFYTKCRAWKSSEETHSEKKWSGQDALSVAAPPTSLSFFGPAALNFNSHINLRTNLQTNSKRKHEQHKAATQTNTNFCGTPVLKNIHQSRLGPFEPHHETLHWVSSLDDESHREACLAEACNSVTTCRK